jgi:hypothetical protein
MPPPTFLSIAQSMLQGVFNDFCDECHNAQARDMKRRKLDSLKQLRGQFSKAAFLMLPYQGSQFGRV